MTQDCPIATRKQRRSLRGERPRCGIEDGVDAGVLSVEKSLAQHVVDRPCADARCEQLSTSHPTALKCCDRREPLIPRTGYGEKIPHPEGFHEVRAFFIACQRLSPQPPAGHRGGGFLRHSRDAQHRHPDIREPRR